MTSPSSSPSRLTPQVATPGPWHWEIHDVSMASLCGPGGERDHVMSVSPCRSCQSGRDEWSWGRCTVPKEADADLISAAPDMRDALLAMLVLWEGVDPEDMPGDVLRAVQAGRAALTMAARSALALAHGAAPDGGEG